MLVHKTKIDGLYVATSTPKADSRGAFSRLFCAEELQQLLGKRSILQINHSRTSQQGAVRGMHFQNPPAAEMKCVRCLKGRVWDVAVDLRADSPTLHQWHAEELSEDNHKMMIIPEGFAHGFQVLAPDSELLYLHTALYAPSSESGVHPLDERLAIDWPMPIAQLSEKDAKLPRLYYEE